MKNYIFLAIFSVLKMLRAIVGIRDKIAIISPAPHGSLGDQALMQGLCNLINETDNKITEILVFPNEMPQNLFNVTKGVIKIQNPYRFEIIKLLFKLIDYKGLVIVGADTLDGCYSPDKNLFWFEIADHAQQLGLEASFVSFSFSSRPNEKVVQRINSLNEKIKFVARDLYSKIRFETFTLRKATLGADLAFKMNKHVEKSIVKNIVNRISEQKTLGRTIICINANPIVLPSQELRVSLVSNYATVINRLLDEDSNKFFLLLPHDFRVGVSDLVLAREILSSIRSEHLTRVILVDFVLECWEAKAIVEKCNLIITGRMHLAIAGLSQGIPTYGLSYNDKFEGLMHHFSLSNNLLKNDEIMDLTKFENFFKFAISNHAQIESEISSKIKDVEALSSLNF